LGAVRRPAGARVPWLGERIARLRSEPPVSDDWLAEEVVDVAAAEALPNGNGSERGDEPLRTAGFRVREVAGGADRPTVLRAEGVTVRFSGLVAVDDASLVVREGTITGLIGPNGAGKTTLFNAILGLNEPTAGRITMFDREVTGEPPHVRAKLGVARTFQVLQLFTELTVFDNLLVATHLHNRSGLASNLVASQRTLTAEAASRRRVRRILRLLELDHIAQQGVRGLSFGTLRMVELGRALVTGARLIMLDEPASGLNEAETDRLSGVIGGLRELGLSVLLIEHDVRMVTGVCDHVYVLDQGRMIADGTSADIQRDPRVIAAYLGEPAEPEPVKAGV
ncbi:MAG: ABC transporter ATP-binding protein, partial [Actinomycetota bacterium]